MEESLVLDPRDTFMFQVLDVHKGTLLREVLSLVGFKSTVIVGRTRSGGMALADARAKGRLLVLHWGLFILTMARREATALGLLIRGVIDRVLASKWVKLSFH